MPERKKEEEAGVFSLSYYFGFPGLPHLRSNWVESTPVIKMEPDLHPFFIKKCRISQAVVTFFLKETHPV